jgi:hypothetical protein
MVREAGEWLGLENAHPFPPPDHGTQSYSTKYQTNQSPGRRWCATSPTGWW